MTMPPNNGMHPTRDTVAVIYINLVGGRVMPGVRLLLHYSPLLTEGAGEPNGEAARSKRSRSWWTA
jgi:hypothetical protein